MRSLYDRINLMCISYENDKIVKPHSKLKQRKKFSLYERCSFAKVQIYDDIGFIRNVGNLSFRNRIFYFRLAYHSQWYRERIIDLFISWRAKVLSVISCFALLVENLLSMQQNLPLGFRFCKPAPPGKQIAIIRLRCIKI